MDDRAPPPAYNEVVKGRGMPGYNPPPEGFLPGPQGASPHTPAGYGQGVPSAPSAFPPPQHAQPPTGGSFPNYTYTTMMVINQPHQHPSDQAGNATATAYQHPIVVSGGPFPQTGAPVSLNQSQQARKCCIIFSVFFVIVIVIVVLLYVIIIVPKSQRPPNLT